MPKRHVLHRWDHGRAHHAGKTRQVLGQHRVLLVRHGRRALLPHRKELRPFQHFGALHVTDFDGDILDAASDHTQCRKERRVTIARDDLCADRFRHKAQLVADMFFDRRVDIGKGADSARDCASGNLGPRIAHAAEVSVHLGIEAGKGQAHRRGFRMDAVRAPDAYRVLVLKGATLQCGEQPFDILDQDVRCAHKLHVETGVEHVRRGHALMHEPRLFAAHMLGKMSEEGDHVMFGDRLDLVDAGDIELDILGLPDRFRVFARDHAQIGHRVAGMGLDLVPDAELGRGFPDGHHFGARITGDHARDPFIGWLAEFRRTPRLRTGARQERPTGMRRFALTDPARRVT